MSVIMKSTSTRVLRIVPSYLMIVSTKRKLTIDLITCHMKAQAMIERPFHNRLESYDGLFKRYDREKLSYKRPKFMEECQSMID